MLILHLLVYLVVPYQMEKLFSVKLHKANALQLMSFKGNMKKIVMMATPQQELCLEMLETVLVNAF